MATATSRKAKPDKKILATRLALADELLGIHRKLAPQFARMDEIEVLLKAIARDTAESFKEEFAGKGHVAVAGPVAAEFKGNVPVIQTEAWLALKPAEKKDLEKRGVVAIEPQYGRASNGRVTVKVV